MVYFIGVEVGVTLKTYFQIMHELGKVNEVKLFYKETFTFKDIFFRLTFACWGERSGSISLSF